MPRLITRAMRVPATGWRLEENCVALKLFGSTEFKSFFWLLTTRKTELAEYLCKILRWMGGWIAAMPRVGPALVKR